MEFNRQHLLRILESCAPGLNTKEAVEQSSCFILKQGTLLTYNGEILCTTTLVNESGEPFIAHGAIPAKPFLEVLRKSPDDQIELTAADDHISIKGTGRRQKIVMSADILLDVTEVETPGEFIDLPPIFSEALNMAAGCTAKNSDNFALNCVAIGPKGLQATDQYSALRFVVSTGRIGGPVLARGSSLKGITGLGLAQASYGQDFVWFSTYSGTRVAVRLLETEYPDLACIFKEPAICSFELPGSVLDIIERTVPFVAENATGKFIKISLADNLLTVTAANTIGDFLEEKPIVYAGPSVSFTVNPETMVGLLRSGAAIEVTPSSLRTKGDGYCLVASASQER